MGAGAGAAEVLDDANVEVMAGAGSGGWRHKLSGMIFTSSATGVAAAHVSPASSDAGAGTDTGSVATEAAEIAGDAARAGEGSNATFSATASLSALASSSSFCSERCCSARSRTSSACCAALRARSDSSSLFSFSISAVAAAAAAAAREASSSELSSSLFPAAAFAIALSDATCGTLDVGTEAESCGRSFCLSSARSAAGVLVQMPISKPVDDRNGCRICNPRRSSWLTGLANFPVVSKPAKIVRTMTANNKPYSKNLHRKLWDNGRFSLSG